ncbi:unnamed protein product [Paramecium pentaurelia]|uniref:Uncharacterized protein n=1 Tax=Paramecium pentaurelia TaxID=43138 RepID=A0A8S1SKX9_9CILI|nr:unnamed protein product [Paramecium pentaurelia]
MENLAVAQTYFPPQTTFVSIYDQQISSPFQKSLLVQDSKTKEDFILLGTVKSQNLLKFLGIILHNFHQILQQTHLNIMNKCNISHILNNTVDNLHYSILHKLNTIQNYQIQIQIYNLYVKFPLIEKVKLPYSIQRLAYNNKAFAVQQPLNTVLDAE